MTMIVHCIYYIGVPAKKKLHKSAHFSATISSRSGSPFIVTKEYTSSLAVHDSAVGITCVCECCKWWAKRVTNETSGLVRPLLLNHHHQSCVIFIDFHLFHLAVVEQIAPQITDKLLPQAICLPRKCCVKCHVYTSLLLRIVLKGSTCDSSGFKPLIMWKSGTSNAL